MQQSELIIYSNYNIMQTYFLFHLLIVFRFFINYYYFYFIYYNFLFLFYCFEGYSASDAFLKLSRSLSLHAVIMILTAGFVLILNNSTESIPWTCCCHLEWIVVIGSVFVLYLFIFFVDHCRGFILVQCNLMMGNRSHFLLNLRLLFTHNYTFQQLASATPH